MAIRSDVPPGRVVRVRTTLVRLPESTSTIVADSATATGEPPALKSGDAEVSFTTGASFTGVVLTVKVCCTESE